MATAKKVLPLKLQPAELEQINRTIQGLAEHTTITGTVHINDFDVKMKYEKNSYDWYIVSIERVPEYI